MPHIIVEYTSNIKEEANIPSLLQTIHRVLLARRDSSYRRIRSRAIELHDYLVADGAEDDAFVHITLKIGSGRSEQVKRNTCGALFDAVKAHFAPLFDQRYLALSLELAEFSEGGTYKHNNIHARYAN